MVFLAIFHQKKQGRTGNWASIDTEYDRAKVPPYNGNDPPPAPGSLKALMFPPLLNNVQTRERKGYKRGTTWNFLQSFPLSGTPVVQSYRSPIPVCKIWRKPGFVQGQTGGLPQGQTRLVPGASPGSSQKQPDQRAYVYVPFSCLIHKISNAGIFEHVQGNSGKPAHVISKCSPCAPAEARRWIFWLFAEEFGKFSGKFGGNLPGIFSGPQNKGSKISGKISEHFS